MPVDLVIVGTTVKLSKIIKIDKPMIRVHFELEELSGPDLKEEISTFIGTLKRGR